MRRILEKQLNLLKDKDAIPFYYTFTELQKHDLVSGFDLKFETNYFVVHIWLIYPSDYPFRSPEILFYNLNNSVKHPLINNSKRMNMCDFSPAIDIRQQIINCYLIFIEILNNDENADLVELGDVTFPTKEEEIESLKSSPFYL